MAETNSQPSGIFRVINDLSGTISKAAESYHDVRMAKREPTVTPQPAALAPAGQQAGTASPEVTQAKKESSKPVTVGLSPMGIAALGIGALVLLAMVGVFARKR